MSRRPLLALVVLLGLTSSAHAAPSAQQLCASAMDLASAKYAQCRLTAQSKDAKAPNPAKLTEALGKCSQKLSGAFGKATLRYAGACAATEPSSAFDAYLKQCSDDTTAAVGGAALPDYVGDLASCNADLTTCDGILTTCTGDLTTCAGDLTTCATDLATAEADLATTTTDLATCEGELAACEALPPVRLLKTGQTTAYGVGSDGDLQKGIAQGYMDNGDGTITDTKTGLMWEKKSDDGTIHDKDNQYSWSGASYGSTNVLDGTAASTFLAALNAGGGFAGHTDWRLPNQTELYSLVNLQNANSAVSVAFNTGCAASCAVLTCSCTFPTYYWSSSAYAGNPQFAWGVDFGGGYVFAGGKFDNSPVRAVRGGS